MPEPAACRKKAAFSLHDATPPREKAFSKLSDGGWPTNNNFDGFLFNDGELFFFSAVFLLFKT